MENSRPRRSSSTNNGRFPLPADYFAQVDCNAAQAAILQQEVDAIVRETIRAERWEMHCEDSSRGWKLSSSKKDFRDTGIRTYCRKPDSPEEKKARRMDFKCMGKVGLPLDQAMEALYSDNTVDYRHNTGTLLDNCLDAAVLRVIKRRSDRYPHRYLGINWLAVRSSGFFAKKRDVCYLKSTGTTFDAEQNEIGYLVVRSIDVKECQSLEQSHGVRRTNVSAILLLKQNKDSQTTTVICQGTLPMSRSSSSKMIDLVHASFMSLVANLNLFTVSQHLAQKTDLERFVSTSRERRTCHLCCKKFSLLRSRHHCHACGEMMCRDCEVTRRVTPLDRDTLAVHPSFAEKDSVRRYCKKCMVSARKKAETSNSSSKSSATNVADSALNSPVAAEPQHDRLSAVSSCGSRSSLQLSWPDLSKSGDSSTRGGGYSASLASRQSSTNTSPTFSRSHHKVTDLSTSQIPESPLAIRTAQTNAQPKHGRERVETDPWEYYDAFEQSKGPVDYEPETGKPSLYTRDSESDLPYRGSETNKPSFTGGRASETGKPSFTGGGGRGSMYSNDGHEMDLAARLLEMSRRAQETLDVTRRNSCMMSDTGSAPRSSEQFHHLDKSIAEQADLLNVIGFVSTGRVYMETGDDEHGEHSGVRISESSIDEDERFEILA